MKVLKGEWMDKTKFQLYLRVQQRLHIHLQKHFPFLNGKRLLIALSGGIDSMVLAHLMHDLGYEIALAHANFQLRKEASEADEQFVIGWAKSKQLKVFTIRFETENYANDEKLSIQMAARKLRYDWFDHLLKTENYDYLLTAHHLEDQLETFLINLSRGTGLEGLTGIPAMNGVVVRPLLIFNKDEIRTFAHQNGISWVEDESNASDKYLRNKIRHQVTPLLKSLHPTFLENFEQTLSNLNQTQQLVNIGFQHIEGICLENRDEKQICNIEKLLQFEGYEAFLYHWLQPFGIRAWNDVSQLLFAETGKFVETSAFKLIKERTELVLLPKQNIENQEVFYIQNRHQQINIPLKLHFEITTAVQISNANTIFVDFQKIEWPLTLRKWTTTDFFFPFGMKGQKKISKFLRDENIPSHQKSDCWVLCSNNEIVWVVGLRPDQRFSVDEHTSELLKIETEPLNYLK